MDNRNYPKRPHPVILGNNKKSSFVAPIVFLSLMSLFLAVFVGLLLRQSLNKSDHIQVVTEEKVDLSMQKNALIAQLDSLELAYDDLLAENAEMSLELHSLKNEIDSLRALIHLGENQEALDACEQRIVELNSMYAAFEDRIHILSTEKEVLIVENIQIKAELNQVAAITRELQMEKVHLSAQIRQASLLKIHNVSVSAFRQTRSGEVETDRARRTDKLRICFTIQDNILAEQGVYSFYFQIMRPGQELLTGPDTIYADLQPQDSVPVSAMEIIPFSGISEEHCVYFESPEGFSKGPYSLRILAEERELWNGEYSLK